MKLNNLGTYNSIEEVLLEYPNGGTNGDYVVIDGVNHYWDAANLLWTTAFVVMEDTPEEIDLSTETETTEGEVDYSNDFEEVDEEIDLSQVAEDEGYDEEIIGGNLSIRNNLTVGNDLRVKRIFSESIEARGLIESISVVARTADISDSVTTEVVTSSESKTNILRAEKAFIKDLIISGGTTGGGGEDSTEVYWSEILNKPSWITNTAPNVSTFNNDADYVTRKEISGINDFAGQFATEMQKWFVRDDANKGIKPSNGYGFYSETYISARGVDANTGGSGGGGGLIQQVFGYSDIANLNLFSDSDLDNTFNAYTIAKLSSRIGYLEGKDSTYAETLRKIQDDLSKKLNANEFESKFATEMAKWFAYDEANNGIYPTNNRGFYSNTYISARGIDTGSGSSGGVVSYDRLDSWDDYSTSKSGYVLSALLGYDLHTRVSNLSNAGYITASALSGYATEQWVTDKGYAIATDVASTYATIEALSKKLDKDKFAESFATEMAKWFVKDDANKGIKPVNSYGLYSESYVSAKGVSTGTGGSGGGGTSYDRLDAWADYTSAKAGYVLSALLGYDLHTRVNSLANAGYITASALSGYAKLSDIPTVPTSLKNPYALSFGNKLYDGSAANTITASDLGALTSHQDVSHLLSKTEAASTYQTIISSDNKIAYNNISGTPASLPASDVYSWAKAANKPSYAFSEITGKPTTLGGYGITDWDVNAYNGNDLNTFYDAGLKLIRNASFNYPSNGNYGTMLVMPSCKAFGNTTTDFAAQIFLPNGDDSANPNDMFFRTSLENTWNAWQRVLTNNNYSDYTYSKDTLDSKLSGYLPLSGGTISSGAIEVSLMLSSTGKTTRLSFAQSGGVLGYLGFAKTDTPLFISSVGNRYSLIHSGNIGDYALKIDGSNLMTGYVAWNSGSGGNDVADWNTIRGNGIRVISSASTTSNAPSTYATGLHVKGRYGFQIASAGGDTDELYFKNISRENRTWKTIAFTDSNVASATKLQTPRTIWGQSFDGTGDVNGNVIVDGYVVGNNFKIANRATNPYLELIEGSDSCYVQVSSGTIYLGSTITKSLGVSKEGNVSVVGNIVASGSVTAKSSSDYRLKCEFDYDVDYQERLLSLGKVCDYSYTEHARQRNTGGVDGNRHTGLIWQDAKRVGLTNFAMTDEDGYGSLNYLSTDYLNTITGAVQMTIIGVRSLLDRTEKIEDKVERLEKENEALRREINDMRGGNYGC